MREKILEILKDKTRITVWQRLLAYVIDAYIIKLLCNIPIMYYKSIKLQIMDIDMNFVGLNLKESMTILCIAIALTLIYLVILPKKSGQTLGKKLMRFKIISLMSDTLTYPQLLLRNGLGMLVVEGVLFTTSFIFQDFLIQFHIFNFHLYYVFLIITILSVIYSCFSIKQMMFHDVLGKTRVIKK